MPAIGIFVMNKDFIFSATTQVCLIERKSDKKVFAMKYVNKEACVALSAVNNVIEEVELLRLLDHPFITSIWYTFQVCLLCLKLQAFVL